MVWQVLRELSIVRVAKEFGVLPSVVARDLDNDPEQLSLRVLTLLRYEEAHRVVRRNNAAELKAYRAGPAGVMVTAVENNDFAIAELAIAAERGE